MAQWQAGKLRWGDPDTQVSQEWPAPTGLPAGLDRFPRSETHCDKRQDRAGPLH